ncbi:MAG: DHHA1 domain-containing protein, partial [Gammaproteobacteria bacterium]|nr:DHHA1 domain-containing protein [Gammaproteobacteria bacterium]
DMAGYEKAMAAQKDMARSAKSFAVDYGDQLDIKTETVFSGYELLKDPGKIVHLYIDGKPVKKISAGEQGLVVLDRTPFYAESGGQVGDHGVLVSGKGKFQVEDTQKQGSAAFVHFGKVLEGTFEVNSKVDAEVDSNARQATACNHSATHLLHAALRQVLGEHVTQKGSLVDAERLRFDFSHFEPITSEQLQAIEAMVNEHIRLNHEVQTQLMSHKEAMKSGAMALFGEKYGDTVRVLAMGDFSVELCGGTHVKRTGDIGLLKIVTESGIAAGVRRIEALTAKNALRYVEQGENQLQMISGALKATRESATDRVHQLLDRNRQLEKELEQLKAKMASSQGSDLASQAEDISGTKVLAVKLDGADPKSLRSTLDKLKDKLGASAVVLATVKDGKVSLVAGVSKDRTNLIKAGDLVNVVAEQVGGKGGGRPDMAQAGGNQPEKLDAALAAVPEWIRSRLVS